MQNFIVGRKLEQQELTSFLNSFKAEFLVVYGRRRVGKTYLISNFFKATKCIFFHSTGIREGNMQSQLRNFANSISETFLDMLQISVPDNWSDMFKTLTQLMSKLPKKRKIVLFLDELPWMATKKSNFLFELDYYWNKYWSSMPNVRLIVCGSSASWIIKKIINDKGGLHNRVTKQITLSPFTLVETKLYLNHIGAKYTNDQILEIYMALGGIPFYLSNIKTNCSAARNIENLCFKSSGILFDEFTKLFESLFDDAAAYEELIRIIANKQSGVTRDNIEKDAKFSSRGGSLSKKLQNLEAAGFISKFTPFLHNQRGAHYKVKDEYCLFYLYWIEPQKPYLETADDDENYWIQQYKTPSWYTWSGYAFEAICYKHIGIIRKALHVPDGYKAAAWSYRPVKHGESGAQIDLVLDSPDGTITICEMKHTDKLFEITKLYKDNLVNKAEIFRKVTRISKQIFIAIICNHGVKDNIYSDKYITSVVILNQLF
jgi:uncharacterized protein